MVSPCVVSDNRAQMVEHTGYIGKPTVKGDRYLYFLFSALDTEKTRGSTRKFVQSVVRKVTDPLEFPSLALHIGYEMTVKCQQIQAHSTT